MDCLFFESLLTYFQGDSYLKNRGALGFLRLLSSSQVLRLCGSQGELISDLQERQMLVTVTCKQGNIYRVPTGDERVLSVASGTASLEDS